MKLRGGKARAAYSHLKYLQREGVGVEWTGSWSGILGVVGVCKLRATRADFAPGADLVILDLIWIAPGNPPSEIPFGSPNTPEWADTYEQMDR